MALNNKESALIIALLGKIIPFWGSEIDEVKDIIAARRSQLTHNNADKRLEQCESKIKHLDS
jgi:hypothetical protein